jgi:hypothetical protein
MWAFLQATLMPVLLVGIGARFLYQTLFPTLLPIRVRRRRCYHNRRRMDRRRVRSNICQGNSTACESQSHEPLNDGHQSLDNAFMHAFATSINPLKALKKIQQVAVLATPVIRKRNSQHLCSQAFLSAGLLTGNTVSATSSVYCSHK